MLHCWVSGFQHFEGMCCIQLSRVEDEPEPLMTVTRCTEMLETTYP